MTREIIILNRLNEPSDMTFRYVLWAARVSAYANATATSAFSGATTAEITAIQAGQVVEQVDVFEAPIGTPIATIQAALIAAFTRFQARITAFNPTVRYGTSFDGTAWTVGGTA